MNYATQDIQPADRKDPKTDPNTSFSDDGRWQYFAAVPNLIRYVPRNPGEAGSYFARKKLNGKSIRKSLETTDFNEARRRLQGALDEIADTATAAGSVGEGIEAYERESENDLTITAGTKRYRRYCVKVLKTTWPGIERLQPKKISDDDCRQWSNRFVSEKDEQYFNNVLGTFRRILELAGLPDLHNPACRIARMGIKPKELELPERDEFERIVESIDTSGNKLSHRQADLVRFLAFCGARISEALNVTWDDVDFRRAEIKIRNAKRGPKSNGRAFRYVPMIPDMLKLLTRLKEQRDALRAEVGEAALLEHDPRTVNHVCLVVECEKALTKACKTVSAPRITHHDLRHLFATRCIEAGVDIPTIAHWLGHVDGGALAMKVYGHLRREHSTTMAKRITFGAVQNVVQIGLPLAAGGAA